eukprot:Hpha_TRINITY_DN15872_c0_g2::TRINITY_DN15872_c0_g2_i1::g.187850::m.187850
MALFSLRFILVLLLAVLGYRFSRVLGPVVSPGEEYMAHLGKLRKETDAVSKSIQQHTFLVIGGTGFTGSAIVNDLQERGAKKVRVMGRSLPPSAEYPYNGKKYPVPGVEYTKGDVTNKDTLREAMRGVSVVIHTAAHYGWPSFTVLGNGKAVEKVNYGGMKNIVEVARELGVKQLIYTCTSDVTFTAKGYVNATEDFPYGDGEGAPLFGDHYARTKIMAEKHALKSDDPKGLRVLSLRPNGIYGPGENSAFQKATAPAYVLGVMPMIFDREQRSDWVCVYNLVYAHMLAVHKLSQEATANKVGGKAFYITDGTIINNAAYEIFLPVVHAVGADVKGWIVCPPWLFTKLAIGMESTQDWVYKTFGFDLWNYFGPVMFTKKEAYKALTTHTHSIQRAKDLLDYRPLLNFEQCSKYAGEEMARRYGLAPPWPPGSN